MFWLEKVGTNTVFPRESAHSRENAPSKRRSHHAQWSKSQKQNRNDDFDRQKIIRRFDKTCQPCENTADRSKQKIFLQADISSYFANNDDLEGLIKKWTFVLKLAQLITYVLRSYGLFSPTF